MRGDIGERLCAGLFGCDDKVIGHGQIAIKPGANGQARGPAFADMGRAPDGHDALTRLAGGKKLPIFQDIPGCGIGDVIGGEGEALDGQAGLALAQSGIGSAGQMGAADIGLIDENALHAGATFGGVCRGEGGAGKGANG